jgi:hypothetical protein
VVNSGRWTAACSTAACWVFFIIGLQDEQHEHGQEKRDVFFYKRNNMSTDSKKGRGNKKGKSDKRMIESKARQKEALHCAQTCQI